MFSISFQTREIFEQFQIMTAWRSHNFPAGFLWEEETELTETYICKSIKSFACSFRQLAKLPVLGENPIYEILSKPNEMDDSSVELYNLIFL